MNKQTLGIIIGMLFTIIVIAISVTLTLFYIYYFQPEFICDLCKSNCSLADFSKIILP